MCFLMKLFTNLQLKSSIYQSTITISILLAEMFKLKNYLLFRKRLEKLYTLKQKLMRGPYKMSTFYNSRDLISARIHWSIAVNLKMKIIKEPNLERNIQAIVSHPSTLAYESHCWPSFTDHDDPKQYSYL